MILQEGDKLLIVHRRLFENDHARFFVGQVDGFEMGIARMTGYTFGWDAISKNFNRKQDIRTKLFPISSGTMIAYCLPIELSVECATPETTDTGLYLMCPPEFSLNLSE